MTNCGGTCDYVARKQEPSNWHGDDPDEWILEDEAPVGLEQEVWECPHEALDGGEYCPFHTDPEDLADDVDEGEQFVKAVNEASAVEDEETARRRKEFVGATFGPFDIEEATLDAGDEHPIRLDHARFACGVNAEGAIFEHSVLAARARFGTSNVEATGEIGAVSFRLARFMGREVSFYQAEFESLVSFAFAKFGDGEVSFGSAKFGDGEVSFSQAEFESLVSFGGAEFGDGEVSFSQAEFESLVSFGGAEFGDGEVSFRLARFRGGEVSFRSAEFSEVPASFDKFKLEFSNLLFSSGSAEFSKGLVWVKGFITEFEDALVSFEGAEFGEGRVSFVGVEFRGGPVSFEGSKFGEGRVSFGSAEFREGQVSFGGAEFKNGLVSYRSAEFGKGVSFRFAKLKNVLVSFESAEFGKGGVSFESAEFREGGVSFESAEFKSGVSFESAEFSEWPISVETMDFSLHRGPASFERFFEEFGIGPGALESENLTGGPVSFKSAEFGGKVSFESAEFGEGDVSFGSATVTDPISFLDTRFDVGSTVVLSEAEFRDHVTFGSSDDESVTYEHSLDFSGATFHRELDFHSESDSTTRTEKPDPEEPEFDFVFAGEIDFSNATFPNGVDFSETRFPPDVEFTGATLEDADFSGADVTGTDHISKASFDGANLTGANFSRATLAGASFERARLSRAELLEANLSGAKLYGALLGDARINRGTEFWLEEDDTRREPDGSPRPVRALRRVKMAFQDREPYCPYDPRYRGNDSEPDLEKAGEVYATLENLASDNSLPELASECFLGRKDVQLREYWRDGDTVVMIRSLMTSLVARYGESPARVLGTGAVTILACGLAYDAFNLIKHADSEGPVTLFESLYFSGLTFTTLGYGDFNPANPAGQVLAVAETSIGVLLLAILVFVFGRRATR